MNRNVIVFLTLVLLYLPVFGQQVQPYNWKNVQIVGGGFVDGIVFHPTEFDLRYCRTDMGGAYRWDMQLQKWIPLLDWLSYEDQNLMGVESIALDPQNPDMLYLSCGTYTNEKTPNGAILRSNNRGRSFERIDVPFKMGGNENGRGNGERMAVDPNNSNLIYLGTRHNGLWHSSDAGKSWQSVASFPDVNEYEPDSIKTEAALRRWRYMNKGAGIVFVLFDKDKSTGDRTSSIYVGVSLMGRDNIFRSTDAGISWEAVSGQPVNYRPTQGQISSNGYLYVTYGTNPGPLPMNDGGVWKLNTLNGQWTNISPDKPRPENNIRFGYASVTLDAQNEDVLMVSTFGRPWQNGGDDIFRSNDGGQSWKPVFASNASFDYSMAPYVERTPIHWMFDIEINPFNPDHALFTTGFGGFETFNLTNTDSGDTTRWQVMSKGIEETVPLELLSPPMGAHLVTAIGDYGGFVHWDLDVPAPEGNFDNPHFGNTDGVACAWLRPELIVRVGIGSGNRGGGNIGVSMDYGRNWMPVQAPDNNSRHGHIAVSALGNYWVWTPRQSPSYRTDDHGQNWVKIENMPNNLRIVADKVNNKKFYGLSLANSLLYISTDGAQSFNPIPINLPGVNNVLQDSFRGDPRGGQDRVYATPGYEGNLWIAAFDGLYYALSPESEFERMNGITEVHAFGFGKEAPGSSFPSLFLVGIVNGVRGVFRSDDQAKSWVQINDHQNQWGLILHVSGDPKKYGRVYVGTHGRGALYGDIMQ